MRGIFVTGINRTAILELPEPEPGPYEALVEVLACGICNSTDWKIIEGEFVSGTFPILLGHEAVGRVISVGREVRSFQVGDLVLRSALRDEHVPFPGGRSCWGGFVEKAIVTDVWAEQGAGYNAFPHPQQIVPEGVAPAHAPVMIPLKEAIYCLRSTDVQPGRSLAIVGTGPVAQALTFVANLSDVHPLVVFGRRAEWAERFARLGADGYVAGSDWPPEAREILERGGFDRAIEAVGSRVALDRCLEVISQDGRVNVYGVAPESEPYLPDQMSDPRVFRPGVAEAEAHDTLVRWIAEGRVDLSDWISHQMPWTDYRRGFDMVHDKTANRVILTFG
ncbi:MAG: alcohol dehydrogenase catalytic domain-containing protein [Anaerolineae bacterium]|nr:alcohol dehydrogenase catalytic domain-containing protein [Anaerolineae bacterium]